MTRTMTLIFGTEHAQLIPKIQISIIIGYQMIPIQLAHLFLKFLFLINKENNFLIF